MEGLEKEAYLSARQYGYAVLQRLMGDEPTTELFEAIDGGVLAEAFEIVGAQAAEAGPLLEAMGAPLDMDRLSSEYARLFVGPAALPAPPWESVYRDRRRTIMTKTTLDVRIAYREQGFAPKLYRRVPDDHIALELDFLAALAGKALRALQADEGEKADELLTASERFLKEHLNVWAGEFAADVEEKANAPFYAAVAKALVAFALADEKSIANRA